MNQRELFLRHVAQTSTEPMMGHDINIVKARGAQLTDASGKNYFDLISGISVSSVGHCHPSVVEAVCRQSEAYMHLMVYGEYNQGPQVKYAQTLTSLLPSSLSTVYFTTGGSEAVEGAVKLAKRSTGRYEVISFRNAYHGSTQGALSLMGDEYFKNSFRPLIPGGKIIAFNDAAQLNQITNQTAAVVVELTQGEAGVIKGDQAFIKTLRKKCADTGALFICDEIQTGFARTGTLFAFEQYGIVPDILLIAKGMGGGLPIGAFVASQELMGKLSDDPVLGHINTFGGNAVCVAAAQACLEVITEGKLYKRAKRIEEMTGNLLTSAKIKQLRLHGALGAVDFGDEELNKTIIRKAIAAGIITDWFLFCPTAFRIAPPLIVDEKELIATLENLNSIIENF
jgi:acetylornithine/N-succinyldiaminopimelate aminotransferase